MTFDPAAEEREGSTAERRPLLGPMVVLAIALGTIAVGSTVEVTAERAHWHGVDGPQCLLRGVLGDAACPGCGLTRATALVLQGRLGEGWQIHGGGFVVVLLCAAAIPFHLDILRRGRRTSGHRRWAQLGRLALLVGVVGPWLWHAVGG